MFRNEKIEIIDIEHHRNGVGGEPFNVVRFTGESTGTDIMVAIVFYEPYYVAVLNVDLLAKGNIAFGENSWRGDVYEDDLRKAIADKEAADRKKWENDHAY